MSAKEIYMDNSATTRQYDEVTQYMSEIGGKWYGNPSSLHTRGLEAERIINAARGIAARTLGAEEREIVFTSGGTESNNLAIRGYLSANPRKGKHIVTSAIEHPSVLETFKYLEENGYEADYVGVDREGFISLDGLESRIRPDTALISLMMVNNETGAVQPFDEVVRLRNALCRNAVIHADAVQAFGKLPVNAKNAGVDLLSVSSHKIHGPKGIGALYVSKSVRIKPILFGGGQESMLRSGTENVPGIGGFGMAADMKFSRMAEEAQKVAGVKAAILKGLESCSFDWKVISPVNSSPYILNVAFPGLRSEVLLHHLEERNIYVSTGSACASRKKSKSHVLSAMGLSPGLVDSAVRFSFSAFNNDGDAAEVIDALNEIVPRITIKKNRR